MTDMKINNLPNGAGLWDGISGHFDSASQILNEMIDNGIANFEGAGTPIREMLITLHELEHEGAVEVIIEDSGTGIKNLDSAFTLGDRSGAEWTLNEHGFGLKHALASADPTNESWKILTRTEDDMKYGQIKVIGAPYQIEDFAARIAPASDWTGHLNGTGTIISVVLSRDMFKTLTKGIRGGMTSFKQIADVLYEDIGFTYSGLIEQRKVNFTMVVVDAKGGIMRINGIDPVKPDWVAFDIGPGQGCERYNLGGGDVDIAYAFGRIEEKQARNEFDNHTARKYYKKNMSSAGVEIRINGRVLVHNQFKNIWGIEKHNAYNHMLIVIDIKSENPEALPATRTSKNGFREGDEKLEALYSWIRAYLSTPVKDTEAVVREVDLFEALKEHYKATDSDPNKIVATEKCVFTCTENSKDNVRLDLYYKTGTHIKIFEGKKDCTSSRDVYQLRMYWDGLVFDGVSPTEGILVAKRHPASVQLLLDIVNGMQDANGKPYNLTAVTWAELLPHPTIR